MYANTSEDGTTLVARREGLPSQAQPFLGDDDAPWTSVHAPVAPARSTPLNAVAPWQRDAARGVRIMMTEPIRQPTVVIVDDDDAVRTALRRLLEAAGKQVITYSSATELLQARRPDAPGCFVIDVRLPQIDGLDLATSLREAGYSAPIIFITGAGDVETSVRAMKSGAVDFLTKPVTAAALLDAVDRAFERDAESRKAGAELRELEQRLQTLTERERQVFSLVVRGMLNKQIAAHLGPSLKTVKVHRGRVMEKMRARSVVELVVMGQRLGIAAADLLANERAAVATPAATTSSSAAPTLM